MEKLNELFGRICSASERGKKGVLVDLQTISEIRDEFWAMKRRAEAAEAKLAELAKQEPVAIVARQDPVLLWEWTKLGKRSDTPDGMYLYARPAPAADLAELVPVPPEFLSAEQNSQGMFELSEDCMTRLAIALSQQAKGLVIKPGHALVPVEPSWEMISAAIKSHEGDAFLPVSLYKSMLAAAPEVE